MIVILRGTSGSGKSTIAQRVMEHAGKPDALLEIRDGLGKPRAGGYAWLRPPVALVGRYDTPCGGCDKYSWKGASDDIEALVLAQHRLGRGVLLEGLMIATWGVARLQRINTVELTCINLTTPLAMCLDAVRVRRAERYAAKGHEAPALDPANTDSKYKSIIGQSKLQRRAGIHIEEHDRASALARTLELLGFAA